MIVNDGPWYSTKLSSLRLKKFIFPIKLIFQSAIIAHYIENFTDIHTTYGLIFIKKYRFHFGFPFQAISFYCVFFLSRKESFYKHR